MSVPVEEVSRKVKKIIAEQLGKSEEEIKEQDMQAPLSAQ